MNQLSAAASLASLERLSGQAKVSGPGERACVRVHVWHVGRGRMREPAHLSRLAPAGAPPGARSLCGQRPEGGGLVGAGRDEGEVGRVPLGLDDLVVALGHADAGQRLGQVALEVGEHDAAVVAGSEQVVGLWREAHRPDLVVVRLERLDDSGAADVVEHARGVAMAAGQQPTARVHPDRADGRARPGPLAAGAARGRRRDDRGAGARPQVPDADGPVVAGRDEAGAAPVVQRHHHLRVARHRLEGRDGVAVGHVDLVVAAAGRQQQGGAAAGVVDEAEVAHGAVVHGEPVLVAVGTVRGRVVADQVDGLVVASGGQ